MAKCCGSSLAGFQQMLRNLLVAKVGQLDNLESKVGANCGYRAFLPDDGEGHTKLEVLFLGCPGIDADLMLDYLHRVLQISLYFFLHVCVPTFLDLSYIRLLFNLILLYHKQE